MFFGIGNKWKNWKPASEYLLEVDEITTITKLRALMKKFVYKWDTIRVLIWTILWDNWQMPDESLFKMHGDCEDAAILAADVLGRVQKRDDVTFIMIFGYYLTDNKRKLMGHCVTAIKPSTTYSIFTNNVVETGFKDFLAIGHRFYPLGLKYLETRDWKGNVLSRRLKLVGTF